MKIFSYCLYLLRYFRYENKYGLACIVREDLTTNNDGSAIDPSQRGMRIKSVGILTSSIIHIQSYLQFLHTEAMFVV
jgi:hypothetical protein